MITPAGPRSRAGNRASAVRWARMLRDAGHRVVIDTGYRGEPCDLMIALHAWRSAPAVERFHAAHPGRPLIVALTGTDIYRFQASDPETTHRSMRLADRLVVLHEAAAHDIPFEHRGKVRPILQSARPLSRRDTRARRHFEVCVVGHLRDEKDPLRAALAARRLPPDSRIRVVHLGKAHSPDWTAAAREEMAANRRYVWLGERPHWQVRRRMGRARVMVLSSRMEGGANVISEAVVAALPVIASRIPGSVGLLGEDYPGYYPIEDDAALADRLLRAERDPGFYRALEAGCTARAHLFTPEREAAGWRALVDELGNRGRR